MSEIRLTGSLPAPPQGGPVEYDDTTIQISTELETTAPSIIFGNAGVAIFNVSSGSKFGFSASAYGVPGVVPIGIRPMVGIGGLSAGALFSSDGSLSVTPQISAGGISYIPATGVCSGFWCIGAGSHGLLPPEAILIISGIEVLKSFFEVQSEDADALLLIIASKMARGLIPVDRLLATLSFLRIRTGIGPKVRQFDTLDELGAFRRGIRKLLAINSRPETIARIKSAIEMQDNPFVKARLMDMLDRAIYEQNEKDFPSSSIESNMRRAVEETEVFRTKYGQWLAIGTANPPPEAEIKKYMANALYLAKKLEMAVKEEKTKDGEVVLKIERSAPFQIKDAVLAARFVESVAAIYRALGTELSGLVAYIALANEDGMKRTVSESARLMPQTGAGEGVLRAEAARVWNLEWVLQMEAFYGGFFHRRAHMRWIAGRAKDASIRKSLTDRIMHAPLPYSEDLADNFRTMKNSPFELAGRYRGIKPAIDALLAAAELDSVEFDGDIGEISKLWDNERVRNWARRPEIVDAAYIFGSSLRNEYDGRPPATRETREIYLKISGTTKKRILHVMRRNTAEVRQEWYRYVGRPEIYLEHGQKMRFIERILDAKYAMGRLNTNELLSILKTIPANQNDADFLNKAAGDFSAKLDSMKTQIAQFEKDARSFRVARDGLQSFSELFAVEDDELEKIRKIIGAWNRLRASHIQLASALKECASGGDGVKKLLEKWDKKIGRIGVYMARIVENHARFNIKRTGSAFLEALVDEAGIDPTAPREESALDMISGSTRARDRKLY